MLLLIEACLLIALSTVAAYAAPPTTQPTQAASGQLKPTSLAALLAIAPDDLARVDVARMNLLCAQGLPGAETLDIDACLATLDRWADRVRSETAKYLYQFLRDPAVYNHCEGDFRMLTLVTVLQQDCNVRYNPARIRQIDFTNAKDLFIHGIIDGGGGGTCASMPALYLAIARRLAYPVFLVTTKAHVFCRWDTPSDRFNIEGAGVGLNTFDDAHYKRWPHTITDAEIVAHNWLTSLTPAETLAQFLASRGHCLRDNGRIREARDAYAHAARLDPKAAILKTWHAEASRDTDRAARGMTGSPHRTRATPSQGPSQ